MNLVLQIFSEGFDRERAELAAQSRARLDAVARQVAEALAKEHSSAPAENKRERTAEDNADATVDIPTDADIREASKAVASWFADEGGPQSATPESGDPFSAAFDIG